MRKYFLLLLLQICPFSEFNTPFPCLQQIPTEIKSFQILFFLPKMMNKIKLSNDWGFISIYSFQVHWAKDFLNVPRIYSIFL